MEAALQALIAAAASFCFVSLLFAAVFYFCRRCAVAGRPSSSSKPPAAPLRNSAHESSFSFDPSLRHVSMSELAAATKNFSPEEIIGDGGFGFVYRARLANGATVAVKRLSADAFHGRREFKAEMETLGRIRHPNLARLLGYCVSGEDRLLVYEFLERGSLDAWLHGDPPEPLTWSARAGVAKGVAAGLAFLHESCRPRIIHRDIKASNVLLDGDFGARIADFGLARSVDSARSHVSTQVAGTVGYMAPEYRLAGGAVAATPMADVYSFGMLMLELATGRRPSWPVKGGDDDVEGSLVWWANKMVQQGMAWDILDPAMPKGGRLSTEEVDAFLGLACRCTEAQARLRPTMAEVVRALNEPNDKTTVTSASDAGSGDDNGNVNSASAGAGNNES